MSLDNAEWHATGFFPDDLPQEAAATHIGMFFAWVCLTGHASKEFLDANPDGVAALEARSATPGAFVLLTLEGTLEADHLSAEMGRFAAVYYDGQRPYLGDYTEALVAEGDSAYHVDDTWETFETLAPILDKRFTAWKRTMN